LQAVADRLRDAVRPSDVVSRFTEPPSEVELARLGGDEFTALILDIVVPEDALIVARRIVQSVARPFTLQGRRVAVSGSVGISIFPDDADNAAALLDRADTAMYRAKASRSGACELYSAEAILELSAAPARPDAEG
jgi:GGDEF domain-containing protein